MLYDGNGKQIVTESAQSWPSAPWATVIHRGWVAGAKENTLPAYYLTKENGYDWGECDIRFTSDGIPVLAHDATITSEDGETVLTVADSTLAELQAVVLETHERFGEIRVATLAQMLDAARLIDLGVLIDIKAGDAAAMATLAKVVLSSGWAKHCIYMPTNTANATAIAAVDHNASFDFVASYTDVASIPDLTAYTALLTGSNTVGFDLNATPTDDSGGISTEVYDAIRAAGLSISFWNIRKTAYKTYMDAGPLRITKQNGADATDLDALYLADKALW